MVDPLTVNRLGSRSILRLHQELSRSYLSGVLCAQTYTLTHSHILSLSAPHPPATIYQ